MIDCEQPSNRRLGHLLHLWESSRLLLQSCAAYLVPPCLGQFPIDEVPAA
ncbi:unnamed protein product [Cladocopium goreaui]|uniref:Uncharacterized protein n=1 Tax=Cladocopium goreaui TaxID=2562237 RepID=A0A9P1BPR6_9DINO|nr:unnamed protein product [Cladocopium goreaui]